MAITKRIRSLSTIAVVIFLTSLPINVDAFYAVVSPGSGTASDYTHATMIREALLRVVARFLETKPRTGHTISPGDLQNLTPLTSTSLIDAYYGVGQVSAVPFEEAISDITAASTDADSYLSDNPVVHFNAEQFKGGNRRLQDTRKAVIRQLKESGPDYAATRYLTGDYLHSLQDFYSNTNWVEMKGGTAYEDLGVRGVGILPNAGKKDATCKSCVDSVQGDCDGNIIVAADILTSGYKSGQGKSKRSGKCSHGGIDDSSRRRSATGGINKESHDLTYSPHNSLHDDASTAAMEATENFFLTPANGHDGLRDLVGDEVFFKFFNLPLPQSSSKSLSIVMDVTGSMSDDIEAAKAECTRLIDDRAGTVNEPATYVLSPFSDPGYGPVLVTTDPDEFKTAISNLTANGGDDCPELAMIGIEVAINNSLPGSDIFVFTDADAKDADKTSAVTALAVSNGMEITFLLTGSCYRKRRDTQPSANHNSHPMIGEPSVHNRRKKRGIDPSYQTIADATGGTIVEVSKENLAEATEIISLSFKGAEVTILDLKMNGNGDVMFTVDSTMSQVTITVTSTEGTYTSFDILDPAGNYADFNTVVNSDKLVVTINAPDSGEWQLQLINNRDMHVVINATTPIDFIFLLLSQNAAGQLVFLQGYPAIGQDIQVLVVITGLEYTSSVSKLVLKSQDNVEIQTVDLSAIDATSYLAATTVPNEDFMIQVEGLDENSKAFKRTRAVTVEVKSVSLMLDGGTYLKGKALQKSTFISGN
ncbi:von Willebrand factor A domain-containing protein 7-like [Glandiceps talaboti]